MPHIERGIMVKPRKKKDTAKQPIPLTLAMHSFSILEALERAGIEPGEVTSVVGCNYIADLFIPTTAPSPLTDKYFPKQPYQVLRFNDDEETVIRKVRELLDRTT